VEISNVNIFLHLIAAIGWGNNSYDSKAGSIMKIFDFDSGHKRVSNNSFLDSSTGMSILSR